MRVRCKHVVCTGSGQRSTIAAPSSVVERTVCTRPRGRILTRESPFGAPRACNQPGLASRADETASIASPSLKSEQASLSSNSAMWAKVYPSVLDLCRTCEPGRGGAGARTKRLSEERSDVTRQCSYSSSSVRSHVVSSARLMVTATNFLDLLAMADAVAAFAGV